jgi:hypothetical protein
MNNIQCMLSSTPSIKSRRGAATYGGVYLLGANGAVKPRCTRSVKSKRTYQILAPRLLVNLVPRNSLFSEHLTDVCLAHPTHILCCKNTANCTDQDWCQHETQGPDTNLLTHTNIYLRMQKHQHCTCVFVLTRQVDSATNIVLRGRLTLREPPSLRSCRSILLSKLGSPECFLTRFVGCIRPRCRATG